MNNDKRGTFAVACTLTKRIPTGLSLAQTLSWKADTTEDEARGYAVGRAKEKHPDYAIEMIAVIQITAS